MRNVTSIAARAGPRAAGRIVASMAGRKLPKTLSSDEVDALMRIPNMDAPTGLRNRCMLELMHRNGFRVGEICALELRDVRWREHEIHFTGKGAKEAVATIDDQTQALLERWKAERRRYAAGQPWLFTTLDGDPVGRRYVWAMLRRYSRRAGIRPVNPHMLRHTFATDLLREGFNLREVQTACRHADIRTTTIYTHVHDAELAEKMRRRR